MASLGLNGDHPTTHSVIGAITGFRMAAQGPSVVLQDNIGMAVLPWVTAPLSSCGAGAIIVFLVHLCALVSILVAGWVTM